MSTHLNAQVVRACQAEMDAASGHAPQLHEARVANQRAGQPSSRIRRVAGLAAGLCLAVTGTGVATAATGASKHLTAGQLQYRLRQVEAKGYAPASCMVGATRLYNARKHRFVTVKW